MNHRKCLQITIAAALILGAGTLNAADVLWRNTESGELGMWRLSGNAGNVSGTQMLTRSCTPGNGCSSAWRIVGSGNFFLDGGGAAVYARKACTSSFACKGNKDILWYNAGSGELQAWFVDAAGKVGDVVPLSWQCGTNTGCAVEWKAVGTGDFNHDGITDVLWHNVVTGQLGYWALDGQGGVLGAPLLTPTCGPTNGCSTDWKVAATGDFNSDGLVDILWLHPSDNALNIWLLDASGNVTSVPAVSKTCKEVPGCTPSSVVVGAADFNGDSHIDVLWYDPPSGNLTVWLLDGRAHVMGTMPLSWRCDRQAVVPPSGNRRASFARTRPVPFSDHKFYSTRNIMNNSKPSQKLAALLTLSAAAVLGIWAAGTPARADADDQEQIKIRRGLQLAPVALKLTGKNAALVGLGSYIVNAQSGCNDCHNKGPALQYVAGGSPFLGQKPEKVNPEVYLGGGRSFGSLLPNTPEIVSRNLTPDGKGQTLGGDSFDKFLETMRSGVDPDQVHPTCAPGASGPCLPLPFDGSLLQIMPWPAFRHMTDHELRAVYEYLGAIPCVEGGPGEAAGRCR